MARRPTRQHLDRRLKFQFTVTAEAYGTLPQLLTSRADYRDLDSLRELLREHALVRFPFAPGENFLGKVTERKTHSISTAAKEFGLTRDEIVMELVNNGVVAPDAVERSPKQVTFPAAIAEKMFRTSSETITLVEACGLLGVDKWQMFELEDADLLRNHRRTGRSETRPYRRAMLEELLDAALCQAKPIHMKSLIALDDAALAAPCTIADVVAALIAGKLTRVGCLPDRAGLLSVAVDPAEVSAAIMGNESKLNLLGVDRRLGCTPEVVRALIDLGHLGTTVGFNPVSRAYERFVGKTDLDAFSSTFASVDMIAKRTGESSKSVISLLADRGLKPGFAIAGLYCFYRIEDVVLIL